MTEIDDGMPLAAGNRGRPRDATLICYIIQGGNRLKYTHSLSPSVTLRVSHRADYFTIYSKAYALIKIQNGGTCDMRFRILYGFTAI